MKSLLAAIVVAATFALPATAAASLASISFRAVPLHGERALASTPGRFDLVGMRWHGAGTVRFRVRSSEGRWGSWLSATPEEEDQPDTSAAEAATSKGWRLGNPTWVGPSNGIRYRVSGRVADLRASFVSSPELMIPLRSLAAAGSPPIVPRSTWGADESIRRNEPEYAPSVRLAIVHHTAGPNGYSPSQAAAIMRGIQLYHVKSNGWNDIGYNFLVDRYGTVYEGRFGGVERNVIGAHARGFNTGSVGVAVIGTFESEGVPAAAEASLEQLLAWRLDLAHVDPLSSLTVVSGGSERFPAGAPVVLRAVSGHRDTGLTQCPGDLLYAQLGAIAARTLSMGLPKLFDPTLAGGLGGIARFRARVSGPRPWKVTVSDALGEQLATGTGKGPTVDWTWDASLVTLTGVRWRIEVPGATAAAGTFGKAGPAAPPAPLAITGLAAEPTTISPNDDGSAETSVISYSITAAATVNATLLDATGQLLAEVLSATRLEAGAHTLGFDGLGQPDGVYTIVLTAIAANGSSVSDRIDVVVTRTLSQASLVPAVFTPNGDGRADELAVTFQLAIPAAVRIRVLREEKWVATIFNGLLEAGPQSVGWDGSKRVGSAPDGQYVAVIEATDSVGTSASTLPFVKDGHAPTLRLLARPPRLWVSEPASVTMRVNGSFRRLEATTAGALPLIGIKKVTSLVAVARDAAGNRSSLRSQ